MLTFKTKADSCASWKSYVLINRQTTNVASWVASNSCNGGTLPTVCLCTTAHSHGNFVVDKDLDHRLALRIEAKAQRVQARSRHDNYGTILLPQEVFWASIDSLHLPWHQVLTLDVTWLPNPSTNAILCTQSLINQCLVIQCILELLVLNAEFNFPLHDLQGLVYIIQVGFLVEERAQVFNLDSQKKFFWQTIELVLHEITEGLKLSSWALLCNIRVHPLNYDL